MILIHFNECFCISMPLYLINVKSSGLFLDFIYDFRTKSSLTYILVTFVEFSVCLNFANTRKVWPTIPLSHGVLSFYGH
jgi:hypothetical protein